MKTCTSISNLNTCHTCSCICIHVEHFSSATTGALINVHNPAYKGVQPDQACSRVGLLQLLACCWSTSLVTWRRKVMHQHVRSLQSGTQWSTDTKLLFDIFWPEVDKDASEPAVRNPLMGLAWLSIRVAGQFLSFVACASIYSYLLMGNQVCKTWSGTQINQIFLEPSAINTQE